VLYNFEMSGQMDHRHGSEDIRPSPLLEHVALDDVRTLLSRGHRRAFPARTVIFQRDDPADGLYVIASGEVRVVMDGADGSTITLAVLGTGEMMGDLALLDGAARSATAIAATDVDALFIPAADFDAWMTDTPAALRAIASVLARRVRIADEQIAGIALLDARERIRQYVWGQFAEKSRGTPAAGCQISLNQTEVAALLGLRRETFNRGLRHLRETGAIAMEGRSVTLLDLAAMRPTNSI
jgi:CRP-like cAMP-binding protein